MRDPIEQSLSRRPTYAGPWRSHHLAQNEPAKLRPEPRGLDIEQLRRAIHEAGQQAKHDAQERTR